MLTNRNQLLITWGSIIIFILIKCLMLTTRFGDGNAYIYMAKVFLEGQLPYRDFIHVDPPGLLYYLGGLRVLAGNNIWVYQLSVYFLDALTALFLFKISSHYKLSLAFLAAPIYLATFTVISVSDFLTGLQPILFLMTLAIYLSLKQRHLLAGLCWGAALLIKLYVIPPLAGVLIWYLLNKHYSGVLKLVLSCICIFILGMLPFMITSFPQLIDSLVIHQFNRPSGTNKFEVFSYFLKHEWLLVILAVAGAWFNRRAIILFPLIFTITFYLLFRDVYFMYLGNLIPWLVILALFSLSKVLTLKDSRTYTLILIGLVYGLVLLYSFSDYSQSTARVGRFTNSQEISDYLKTLPSKPLYGSYEVVPILALQTNLPILNNYINSNEQNFSSGVMDKDFISNLAVDQSAYLIGRILDYPERGVVDVGYDGYFSEKIFKQYCQRLKDFPSTSKEIDSKIIIYQCQK